MESHDGVEWPPPGLDALHGRLLAVRARAVTATLVIAPAMLWLLLGLPVSEEPIRAAIAILIALGLFLFLTSILHAARVLDVARKGRALGYHHTLLLEVATDSTRDTPLLVTGTGPYESVRDRTRSRIRQLRTFASVLTIFAAVLPLPLLCAAMMLALRGSADSLAVALIPLLPILFFSAAAAVTSGYAAILAQWDRGSDAWDPSPVSIADRAAEWQGIVIAATDDGMPTVQPRRRAGGGIFVVLMGAAAGVLLFVSLAFTIVIITGYGIVVQTWRPEPLFFTSRGDVVQTEFMREWRLPPDSSVSALAAGQALHSLLVAGGDTRTVRRAPVSTYDRPLWPSRSPDSFWATSYFAFVANGRRMERGDPPPPAFKAIDSLAAVPMHPALRELALLARATDLDITAARFDLPLTDSMLRTQMSFPRSGNAVSGAAVVAAAQRMHAGDPASAELLLRQLISAGLLLVDHAPFMMDFSTGVNWVSAGRRALISLYAATGRDTEADIMRRLAGAIQSAATASADGIRGGGFGPWAMGRSREPLPVLFSLIRDESIYPALRWSAFQSAVPLARCGTLRAAMFGPDAFTEVLIENSVAYLTRLPSDSALTDAVLDAAHSEELQLSRRPGFRRLQLAALAVIGPHQLTGPCAGAFTARF